MYTEMGSVSAYDMFQHALAWNSTSTWMVRGLGWLFLFISISLILGPISAFFNLVPFFGGMLASIASIGVTVAALMVSLAMAFVTVAAAWMFHRPLLSATLLASAVGMMLFVRSQQAKVRDEASAKDR